MPFAPPNILVLYSFAQVQKMLLPALPPGLWPKHPKIRRMPFKDDRQTQPESRHCDNKPTISLGQLFNGVKARH